MILSEEEKVSERGKKLLQLAIDELKLVTRRYARKQIKWTKNRFLSRKDRQVNDEIIFEYSFLIPC